MSRAHGGVGVRLWLGLAVVAVAVGLGCAGLSSGARALTAATAVVVPQVRGHGALVAYQRLHAAGLRVSIPSGLSFDSQRLALVTRSSPAAGRRVPRGSAVALSFSCCVRASPVHLPKGPLPSYRLPRFAGDTVSRAYLWATQRGLAFRAHLGPLSAGNANGLFANYRLARQRPTAGVRLAVGTRTRSGRARFTLTPLVVWGVQPSPPCTPPTAYTLVASSAQAVITSHPYEVPGLGITGIRWYGCLRAVGKTRVLSSQVDWYRREGGHAQIALAGRFAALTIRFVRHFTFDCTDRVEIYDLNTAKPGQVFTTSCRYLDPEIDAVSLNTNGFAAWRRTQSYPSCDIASCVVEQLYTYDDHGTQLLDSDSSSARNSLTNIHLTGNLLTWTTNGIAHQTTLS